MRIDYTLVGGETATLTGVESFTVQREQNEAVPSKPEVVERNFGSLIGWSDNGGWELPVEENALCVFGIPFNGKFGIAPSSIMTRMALFNHHKGQDRPFIRMYLRHKDGRIIKPKVNGQIVEDLGDHGWSLVLDVDNNAAPEWKSTIRMRPHG